MKTNPLFLAALLAASSFAQDAWVRQSRPVDSAASGMHTRTPSIRFFGTDKGWALTPGGRLLKTSNGGTTWVTPALPAGDFKAISFLSPDTGWVATSLVDSLGGNPINYVYVASTVDGGTTWKQLGKMTRSDVPPWDLHFFTPDSGWAFSGWAPFFRTTNGGETWKEAFADPAHFYKAHFSPSGMVWCLMRSSLLKKDSVQKEGRHWTEVARFSESKTTHAVFFADSNRGWLAGNGGSVRRTSDQGKTWAPLTGMGTGKALHALYFFNRDAGWVFGDSGTALRTRNGGDSWNAFPVPTLETIVAVDFADFRNGWALGDKGSIFRSVEAVLPIASSPRVADLHVLVSGSRVHYRFEAPAFMTMTLLAPNGKRVFTLYDGRAPAGDHALALPASGIAPGIHFLDVLRNGQRTVRAVLLP